MAASQPTSLVCAYCGKDATIGAFNDEHVLPQALGGNLEPTNPFRIRTHARCNQKCGTWVDAPFIRSWLIHNARVFAGYDFVDPSREPILPLFCMGRIDEFHHAELVCELWLGPTGDHVYHFHRPYPVSPAIVGRPTWIRADELDAGVVFVRLVGTNPAWHPIVTNSIRQAFPRASRHYLNLTYQGQGPPYPPIPDEHAALVHWINTLPSDNRREGTLSIDPECGHRFLVKMALGFGALVLGDAFVGSAHARLLQQALWERDTSRWPPGVHGTPFLREERPRSFGLLDWKGCHTICVVAVKDPKSGRSALGLTLNLYGTYSASVLISDEPALWEGRVLERGTVWVVAPGLRRFAGPMSMVDYMKERLHGPTGALEPLFRFINSAERLPPFHLGDDEGSVASRNEAQPSHEEVAVAAYFRWLARGGPSAPAGAVDDWLAAERELGAGLG